MKLKIRAGFSAIALLFVLAAPSAAQHKHTGQNPDMSGMKMEMAGMMQSAHHKLMMAYVKSMSVFASALREQTTNSQSLDAEVARATVAELRHDFDAVEALHQKHMQSMGAEMQSKMQTMMQEMDKHRTMIQDQVTALETEVQAEKPDAAQVRAHANALIMHLTEMSGMHSGSKSRKKTSGMKMKM
jgi:uncharacterized membrane protein YjgN (DUF898 family)